MEVAFLLIQYVELSHGHRDLPGELPERCSIAEFSAGLGKGGKKEEVLQRYSR